MIAPKDLGHGPHTPRPPAPIHFSLEQWFSEYGHPTSSSKITEDLFRNANSWASCQTYGINNFGGGAQQSVSTNTGDCGVV